jgi:hypothetical protein
MIQKLILFCLVLFATPAWGLGDYQKGLSLYQNKEYEAALKLFQQDSTLKEASVGCLIGQVFCEIALGRWDMLDDTLNRSQLQLKLYPPCKIPDQATPLSSENQHAAYLCRRRVRDVANQMRQTVEHLVRENVPGVFKKIYVLRKLYPFIDALERVGLNCCQNYHYSEYSLNPLIQQLITWNEIGLPQKK